MERRPVLRARHPVGIYFALVFAISWGGTFLVVGPGRFPPSAEDFARLGGPLYLAILAGPCLAGILLTGLVDGSRGFRELLARLRRWRAGWRWYALALVPGLTMIAAALLLAVASSEMRPALLDSGDKGGIVMRALVPALMVGIFEEIGWTGFAVPHLRSRHSILVTGLAVGVVWGAWHFPLFWEPDSFSAPLPLAILLARLFAWLPAVRVLLVRIHDRTRSLPVVMLMHAFVSFVAIALAPATLSGVRLLTSVLVIAAAMWLLLGVTAIACGRRPARQPLRARAERAR